MKVGSLFSGIGGLEKGLERAGMEVVYQAEYDKQARRVLARHWPDVHRYEDVHDVGSGQLPEYDRQRGVIPKDSGEKLGRLQPQLSTDCDTHQRGHNAQAIDVICGGFPCQDYSVAGKRGGLVGDRGALWWEMHRIASEQRPTWVIGENVPGLLSSNGGADFRTIIASLVQLGYGVCWATLDSQYFGVAQRRRRLFIVGHSGGIPRPEILAISEGLFGHPPPKREAGSRPSPTVVGGAPFARTGNERVEAEALVLASGQPNAEITRDLAPTLNLNRDGAPIAFDTTQITSAANRSNPKAGDPCHPLAAGAHAPAIAFNIYPASGQGSVLEASTTELSNALNPTQLAAKTERGTRVLSPTPRRLTPTECERLQGFPDGHTEFYADGTRVADGPRYRMLGNAVTVTVAEWIGRRIMEAT